MNLNMIGIGIDCINVIDRLAKNYKDTRIAILDTEDRLVDSTYYKIPLQKEFLRKLNRGGLGKNMTSDSKSKLNEDFVTLVREMRSFIDDATDIVFIISSMAGEAGSRVTEKAALAVKYCSNRKSFVLDRRIDIHRSMPPYLSSLGFMDIQVEFNDMNNGKRPIKEVHSNKDDVIFNIISHCMAETEENGVDSISSKSILEKVKGVNIDSNLYMHMKEKTSYKIEATKLLKNV